LQELLPPDSVITLTLQEAVMQALEHNLDIQVSRFTRDVRLTDILPPDIDDGARPLPLGARPDPDGGVPRERRTVGIDANGDPLTPPPGVAR
jgi:hypothetical protein